MEELGGREPFEHVERAEHGSHAGGFVRRVAILVAALAALLAIATLSANSASERTILHQGEASDAYNEFQANSLKQHINESQAAVLRLLAAGTPQAPAAAAEADRLDRAVKDKYAPTKAELLVTARDLEKQRDRAGAQHQRFQLSEGAFQIAIVITSVSLLTSVALLAFAGIGLGVLGLILMIAGYAIS